MPPPEIRAASLDDIERIAEIHVASWASAYTGLIPDEAIAALTVPVRIENWREVFADPSWPDDRLWVLVDEGDIQGFLYAGPSEDEDVDRSRTVNVICLYLDPDARGRGYGRALMVEALADFAARGFHLATLYVLIENGPARRFYARLGWIEEPEVEKECFGEGIPAPQLRYRLPLNRSAEGAH
jgi:ribosomal protein S18 acetylase RimI-like enzyme